MRELLWDLIGEEVADQQGLPPGFRFHPTDEELVTFYLASKIFHGGFCGVNIVQVDLNRCEPWELPDVAKMGEKEWYFFSLRDRKYPTGLRTNRATGAGYWKATGKDREVHSSATGALVGMKKTLVFYKGRAPRGEKTKWVLHEYRLVHTEFSSRARHACKEEWVICRILHKTAGGAVKKSQCYYPNPTILMDDPSSSSFNSCGEINYSIPTFMDNPNYIHGLQPPPFNSHQEVGHSLFPLPLPPLPSAAAAILQPQLNEEGQYCSPHQQNLLHLQPSLQEDSASMSAWFERCLQSPFQLYDVGLPPFGIQLDPLLESRSLNIYN